MATCFLNFILLCIVASLAITGWFGATRGEVIVQADGTRKKSGKIFMAWYFFWAKKDKQGKNVFPHWVHSPLATCITCMPTLYGNLIFWVFYASVDREIFNSMFLYPFPNKLTGLIEIWIAYWLSCSYICTLFWKLQVNKKN